MHIVVEDYYLQKELSYIVITCDINNNNILIIGGVTLTIITTVSPASLIVKAGAS